MRAEIFAGAAPEFVTDRLDNDVSGAALDLSIDTGALERVADVPIHFADALARRAPSLQRTRDATQPTARMNAAQLQKLGIAPGLQLRVKQGAGSALLAAALDERLPEGVVRIAAAHPSVAGLSDLAGAITVEAL